MSASPATVRARAIAATDTLPPTFPIGTFVAANPLRGLEHLAFERAAHVAGLTTGARSFLRLDEYRRLQVEGRITDTHLRAALARRWPEADLPVPVHDSPRMDLAVAALVEADDDEGPAAGRGVSTRSEHDGTDGTDGTDGLAGRLDAYLSQWCAVFLDRGQADWSMPGRELGIYAAWRALAAHDPGLARLVGRAARRRVADLPIGAAEALAALVTLLEIADDSVTEYFRASLRRLPGFASALARSGDSNDVVGFLALRLTLEHLALAGQPVGEPWSAPRLTDAEVPPWVERSAVWQDALELGYRDHLLGLVSAPSLTTGATSEPAAQVVMCIDVRSEGFRRRLEEVGRYETLGFAGFFGLAVRVAVLEHDPVPSCPVIVEPKATVVEVADVPARAADARHDRYVATEAAWDARHDAKTGPAAPFAFAEAAGWVLGPLAALNTFAPGAAGRLRRRIARVAVPGIPTRIDVGDDAGHCAGGADAEARSVEAGRTEVAAERHRHPGFTADEQISVAHGALTTMGLTSGFAPIVVLCGHRSVTTNNPFAAALDCGACAGKAGGPNARALAEVLNRDAVRTGLGHAGIEIPASTWFVAAEHDTTSDTVTILDTHRVPSTHRPDLTQLRLDLADAGALLADERLALLPGARPGSGSGASVTARRGADWAEPVPEWGLARNAAMVVGPRELTFGRDLQRRVFLHSYDTAADTGGAALGVILTGPLVVGHWISSQYYFSSVDPDRHGAGTKPLHNVVGGIGVHEGPGGDLRVGLPLESVQFAGARMHEPLRLLAVVQAPRERLDMLIHSNAAVAQLLDNGWIRLVAGSNGADGWAERLRSGAWSPVVARPDGTMVASVSGSGAQEVEVR